MDFGPHFRGNGGFQGLQTIIFQGFHVGFQRFQGLYAGFRGFQAGCTDLDRISRNTRILRIAGILSWILGILGHSKNGFQK